MGVLGQSRDQGSAAVFPTAQGPVDKTGFFQNIGAGFRQAVAGPHSTQVGQAIYEKRAYDQIVQALTAEGEQGADYISVLQGQRSPVPRPFRNPYVSPISLTHDPEPFAQYLGGDTAEKQAIWAGVQKVRQRKPDFLKDFPDEGSLSAWADKQRQSDLATSERVTSRANVAGTVGQFIGGMGGSLASMDPENVVASGFGGAAGKTVARTILKRSIEGAGANAAAAIVASPAQAADAQRLGQEMTTGDVEHQVVQSAAIGAFIPHILHVPEGIGALGRAAVDKAATIPPVRDALVARSIAAGTVEDHSLLTQWSRTHNPQGIIDTSSPVERAAANVIVRDAATKEASPLHPEAVAQNDHRLDRIAQSLGVNLTTPDVPTTAPLQTPTVRDRSGTAPRRSASYAEATVSAEGKDARNQQSTADGYGQFTEGTWIDTVKRHAPQLAEGKSKAEILALRHDKAIATRMTEAYGNDNGAILRQHGLEDSPGNKSLAHFLGPVDAVKVLHSDPSMPIERVIDPRSFAANRKLLEGKSASEVVAWAHKRVGASVDQPVARADAVPEADILDPADYSAVPYERATFTPDELPTATSDTHIEGEQWDPIQSGELLLWERSNGDRIVVDGQKRLAFAQRLNPGDPSIRLPAVILREADGVTEQLARAAGMLKNVNLGKGSLEERAALIADMPEVADLLRSPEHHREIAAIAQLPYERFGDVLNGRADPAKIARAAVNERTQKLAEQIRGYWSFQKEHGFRRKPVQVVSTEDGTIRTWVASASENAVGHEFRDGDTITRLKPDDHATLDALLETLNGRRETPPIAAGNGDRGAPREPSGEAGSGNAAEAPDSELPPSVGTLFDHAIAARDKAEAFSDPVGEGAKAQTDILDHDLMASVEDQPAPLFDVPETQYRLSEEGDAKPLHELMQEAESDELAAQALRDCLK